MVKILIRITLFVGSVILLTSCLKLQVDPKGIVDETVSAGKSLYETIKRKKDGTEERLYSHTIELLPEANEQQIGKQCLEYLTESINTNSDKDPQVLETGTELMNAESGNKMKCFIRAIV